MFLGKNILKYFMSSFYFLTNQGQFSINLAGTGMKISSTAKWLAQGRYASVIIHRSKVSPAGPTKESGNPFCTELALKAPKLIWKPHMRPMARNLMCHEYATYNGIQVKFTGVHLDTQIKIWASHT